MGGRGRDNVWARGDAKEAAMNWDGSLKRKVAKAQDEKSYHGKINRKKSGGGEKEKANKKQAEDGTIKAKQRKKGK